MRRIIAKALFKTMIPMQRFASWIYPESTQAVLGFNVDDAKVRIHFAHELVGYKKYAAMYHHEWYETVNRVNNLIDEKKQK